jgi:hypothetical protein
MLKHTALAAMLVATIAPVAAAQNPSPAAAPVAARPRLQQIVRLDLTRIRRGVRARRITAGELTRLRTRLTALRTRLQALHASGARPTPAQRLGVRRALRRISRAIWRVNHNGVSRAP